MSSPWRSEHPTNRTPMAIELRDTQRALASARPVEERQALTVISGPNAGLVFTLHADVHVMGRGEVADLRVDEPDVSRVHLRLLRMPDGHYEVEDAGSTNGTFLGADRVERAALKPGDRIQLGPHLVLRYSITDEVEQELLARMHESATRDHLTRLYNRRHFLVRLASEMAHARRHPGALALLLMDLDGLKRINDTEGHAAGDVLLKTVASRLSRLVRAEDVLARFGSDEFVILARSTPLAAALALGERLRVALGNIELPSSGDHPVVSTSLSVGVAALSELPEAGTPLDLVALAEDRLQLAKRQGGDRVSAG